MKTVLCFGDSITDMSRDRNRDWEPFSLGSGYPFLLETELGKQHPNEYSVINRGIGGNRSVDLYARIKIDVWNLHPDYVIILIGVNDVWHEIGSQNGVEIPRFKKVVTAIVEDTKAVLPDTKIILMEPFVLHGQATDGAWDRFTEVYQYAKTVKDIATATDCPFIPLQAKMDEAAAKYGPGYVLYDGVHPSVQGSRIITESLMEQIFNK